MSADALAWVGEWIEASAYARALGVEIAALSDAEAELRLPYRDSNSNPGKALHGGCAASLALLGGQCLARAALGPASGPWHTAVLQVNYLAAAIGEDVVARARLLRRGREMCFADVRVETEAGKPIASAGAAVRGRAGAEPAGPVRSAGDAGEAEPGSMGPHVSQLPFIGGRGITVEHMAGGRSRLVMPFREDNADAAGGVHEGAVAALFDTTGAMAAWAECGPGPYKASTPSLQLQVLEPARREDLIGYGRAVQRDREIYWADVEIASAQDARVVARGTVLYRILTD